MLGKSIGHNKKFILHLAVNTVLSIVHVQSLMYFPTYNYVGPIWLDDLNCRSSAEVLEDCTHRGWAVHNCDHGDDVSVICDPGMSLESLFLNASKSLSR